MDGHGTEVQERGGPRARGWAGIPGLVCSERRRLATPCSKAAGEDRRLDGWRAVGTAVVPRVGRRAPRWPSCPALAIGRHPLIGSGNRAAFFQTRGSRRAAPRSASPRACTGCRQIRAPWRTAAGRRCHPQRDLSASPRMPAVLHRAGRGP